MPWHLVSILGQLLYLTVMYDNHFKDHLKGIIELPDKSALAAFPSSSVVSSSGSVLCTTSNGPSFTWP